MEFVTDGLKQFYTDTGDARKEPLVLIHGFPHTHKLWASQIAPLSENHRVIAYDLRGFGASEGGDGALLIDFLVHDLVALLDHLRLDRAHVAGLSMGGYVALRAIEKFPERFRSLLLCDTAYKADGNPAKEKRAEQIRNVRKNGMLAFVEAYADGVLTPETLAKSPEKFAEFRAMMLENGARAITSGLIAMAARTDSSEVLPKIRVPTLVVVGEKDPTTPVAISREMQAAIPGAKLEIIPGAGHLSNFENPDAFNRAVAGFLRGLNTG